METRLQAKKKALQMTDSGDKETELSDLTTALQGLVANLAQQEQRTVNITKLQVRHLNLTNLCHRLWNRQKLGFPNSRAG